MENNLIKNLALGDRPRERLLAQGAQALSNVELLAILLGSGTRRHSALDLARDILTPNNDLAYLARLGGGGQLLKFQGLGPAKAAVILAALEVGRRIAQAESLPRQKISSAVEAAEYLMPRLRYAVTERFVLVLVNSKNRVIGSMQIAEGSLNSSVVHPREVFAPALEQHAAALIAGHNHPSGDPRPSDEDKALTEQLVKAGNILGIPLLDHIIIGDGRYYSFKDHGLV